MDKKFVFAIHGLGGHSGWFSRLGQELAKCDIELVAYDLPGFGTNKPLGHVDSFQQWINFAQEKYNALKASHPQASVAVLGHSLGAVIACNLKIQTGDKLILSVPGFKGAKSTFNPNFVINVLSKYFIDKLIFGKNIYLDMPVSSKACETPAMNDPLRVSSVTQTLLFEILKLGKYTKKNLKNISVPVFMIQLDQDQVVDIEAQNLAFAAIPGTQKTFKQYSGADHDWIWYEINADIARDIAAWL